MNKIIYFILTIFISINKSLQTAIPQQTDGKPFSLTKLATNCLKQDEIYKCFKKQAVIYLDDALKNNNSWYINEYMSFKIDPDYKIDMNDEIDSTNYITDSVEDLDEVLKEKFNKLTEARSLQFSFSPKDSVEGRKKKGGGKDKGMMMMAGMGLAALLGQLLLGKVALMSAAALIMAKISLIFSLLFGLKKILGNSSGGGHVVVASQPAEHSTSYGPPSTGWQRSIDPANHDIVYKAHVGDDFGI